MKKVIVIVTLFAIAVTSVSWANSRTASKPEVNGLLGLIPIPANNPQTPAKISLGKQLFFDTRLSSNDTVSCATCHNPAEYWADRTPVSAGVVHRLGKRNTPTILNAGYSVPQFWDGRAVYLEKQAVGPVANPLEMDLPMPDLIARLNAIPGYRSQFISVFGTEANENNIAMAIASFERTIVNGNSPYDEYLRGNKKAMSKSALRGMKLFSGKGGCSDCHSGPYFSDSDYHNLGIGYKNGHYLDVGRYDVTKNPKDMGAFKTPTLRNAAMTPPYMHDGSEKTLMDVINLYVRGGIPNPHLDPKIKPLHLTNAEKTDLVAFIKSLTGKPVLVSPPQLPKSYTGQEDRFMTRYNSILQP
ncbi:MAG: cytochrome c peroxidase [Armatimonadota bacterium]